MADLFSGGSTHEILDYIIRHSYNSVSSGNVAAVGNAAVLTLAAATPWLGTFCEDATLGTVGATFQTTVTALTDHNAVLTTVPIPTASGGSGVSSLFLANFDGAMADYDSSGSQAASCGQKGTICAFDRHCCVGAEHVWGTGADLECSYLECETCGSKGTGCSMLSEGSDCCRYDNPDYRDTGMGLHCDLDLSGGSCVSAYPRGATCAFSDGECDSQDCCVPSWSFTGNNGCAHTCTLFPCCN